jgi:hypothetical protein
VMYTLHMDMRVLALQAKEAWHHTESVWRE